MTTQQTKTHATNRNLDALVAALDQEPTGLLRTLLRLLKRYYERTVPAWTAKGGA